MIFPGPLGQFGQQRIGPGGIHAELPGNRADQLIRIVVMGQDVPRGFLQGGDFGGVVLLGSGDSDQQIGNGVLSAFLVSADLSQQAGQRVPGRIALLNQPVQQRRVSAACTGKLIQRG